MDLIPYSEDGSEGNTITAPNIFTPNNKKSPKIRLMKNTNGNPIPPPKPPDPKEPLYKKEAMDITLKYKIASYFLLCLKKEEDRVSFLKANLDRLD